MHREIHQVYAAIFNAALLKLWLATPKTKYMNLSLLFPKCTIFNAMHHANVALIKRACGDVATSVMTTDEFSM